MIEQYNTQERKLLIQEKYRACMTRDAGLKHVLMDVQSDPLFIVITGPTYPLINMSLSSAPTLCLGRMKTVVYLDEEIQCNKIHRLMGIKTLVVA